MRKFSKAIIGVGAIILVFLSNIHAQLHIQYQLSQPPCNSLNGTLTITNVMGGITPYYFYTDSTNISTNPVKNVKAGTHLIYISDSAGSLDSLEIIVIDPPALSLGVKLSAKYIDPGDLVKVDAILEIDIVQVKKLNWRPQNIFDNDSFQLSQTIPLVETTNIALEMVDTNNCTVRANDTVFVSRSKVFFPNVIMVNSDLNSYFTAYTDQDVKMVNFLEIRDRWGKIMFFKSKFPPNDTYNSWNGRFNGKMVSEGTYIYRSEIEYHSGKKTIYQGEVTVLY